MHSSVTAGEYASYHAANVLAAAHIGQMLCKEDPRTCLQYTTQ